MSLYDMNGSVNIDALSEAVFDHEKARVCLTPMGQTSENVAEKYGITRQQQDTMAVESHRKAALAQKNGLFDSIIFIMQAKLSLSRPNSKIRTEMRKKSLSAKMMELEVKPPWKALPN